MKKNFTLLIALVVIAFTSHAQGTWKKKADFGGGTRAKAAGFSLGSKGYIGTGNNCVSDTKDFWEYDTAISSWTQIANVGGNVRANAAGFSIGSIGYIGAGYNGSYTNEFWAYDSSTNIWTQKTNFAGTTRQYEVGFSIGGKGYIGTGYDGRPNYKKDFWEYDPSTNAWAQKADFGGTARALAVGFSIGNKGYIGTGEGLSGFKNDFWEYDPASNIWSQKADFGGSARSWAVGFSIGNKGYIGTGQDPSLKKDFWEYDPSINAWAQKADFEGAARFMAVGFSIGNKGYIGTGYNNAICYKDFWEYSPCDSGETVYADADADGYGNVNKRKINPTCDIPTGYVPDSTDCNDANPAINPSATEVPGDKKDNNCNGQVDENNALRFDGVNDYVSLPALNLYSNAVTIEAWIKPNTEQNLYPGIVFCRAGNTVAGFGFGIDPTRINYHWNDNPLTSQWTGGPTYFPNEWQHVALVIEPSKGTIYLNGIPYVNNVSNDIEEFNGEIRIGQDNCCGNRSFRGNIDEVRIWNKARTKAEIQSDMNTTGCGNAEGLVAYYSFNQGIAGGDNTNIVTADDITSNNNNGTLINFALTGSKSNWVKGAPGLSDSITLYRDADGDKYGNAGKTIRASVCKPPAGYVSDSTDCNDANASIHPGAVEVVNGIDDNCNGLKDEGNWRKETDFVMAGRISAVAFTYGSKVYFGLGKTASGDYMNDFWEYDPVTKVWTQKVNFKGSKRFRATAFSIGTKGYVGTGCDYNGSLVKDFWEYNIGSNNWRRRAYFGGAARQYATGFSIAGKGYIGTGGDYLRQYNDFWEYNPATNSWTRKANAGYTAREAASSFAIGNKGYIGLGYNSSEGYKKDFWEYDPATNSWKRKTDFAGKARSAAAGFVLYKRGYIGTGFADTSVYSDFWEYNPANNNWRQVAAFKGKKRAYAVGFSIGNRGYIGTGGDLSGNAYKDFWEYNNGVALPGVAGFTNTEPFAQIANVEFSAIAGYKLWPNPVRDILHLDNLMTRATISILAPDGRIVGKKIISNGKHAWNVKALAAGSYYMKIEEETKITVLKFIKQ